MLQALSEPRTDLDWYAGATRQERIAHALSRNNLDVLLALTPENAAYLSGTTSIIATLWRLSGLVAVAVDAGGRQAVAAGDQEIASYASADSRFSHPLWIEHLDLRDSDARLPERVSAARPAGIVNRPAQYDAARMLDAVASAARALLGTGRKIGAEFAQLPAWIAEGLLDRLVGIDLVDATAVFDDLRAIKDRDEIDRLQLAAELTEIGIGAARDALRPGLSAVGVTAAYQAAIWQAATVDDRFAALRQVEGLVSVGDGSRPALVAPGETVKLDMQVDAGGYHSDVGRTYALAPTNEQRVVYDALKGALDAAIAAMAPGVPLSTVWTAGTEAMRAAGFSNYSRGHLGHSGGLAHHYEEPPFIAASEPRPLAPGMVLSVELPYYLLGVGNFQMERMVRIGETDIEVLDRLPFELEVDEQHAERDR